MVFHYRNYSTAQRTFKEPTSRRYSRLSVQLNVVFFVIILALVGALLRQIQQNDSACATTNSMVEVHQTWNGGHPQQTRSGSCWCGFADHYCLCTPNLAIDLVIVSGEHNEYLWLVRRRDTDQLATMGGFVEVSESVETAVRRELKEEMGIDVLQPLSLLGVYSDPRRDNRRHTTSVVFVVRIDDQHQSPHAGDDVKEVIRISIDNIEDHTYFADHLTILTDYRSKIYGDSKEQQHPINDFASDIARSTCASNELF